MLIEETHPRKVIVGFQCSRCFKFVDIDDTLEYQESHHIDFVGGYGSVFEDGTHVHCDLCQQCLKDLIGEFAETQQLPFYS